MAREIKFRAFSGRIVSEPFTMETGRWEEYDLKDAEGIEQYTGLKDSNDVEVFAGDILERDDIRGVVTWEPAGFWFCTEDFGIDFYKLCYRSEVVGNIHENLGLMGAVDGTP